MLASHIPVSEREHSRLLFSTKQLAQYGAEWTAKEISQQPKMWRKVNAEHLNQSTLPSWLSAILAKPQLRVVLTGAGTSAYIGEALAAHIQQHLPLATQRVEAISSTDLVSHPELYLNTKIPTLLISYGRSGNSPESMAAVALVEQLVDDCYHLAITCNGQGELAQYCEQKPHCYVYKLPDETHDVSFAMTSSFTCMYLATLLIFSPNLDALTKICQMADLILSNHLTEIRAQAEQPCQRIVFLGGGPLKAIAQEAALKYLELTAGKIMSAFETPLGFRHGPKSLVDNTTQVLVMSSSNDYSKKYDIDLINELTRDNQALSILTLSESKLINSSELEEVWLGLPFILWCQILSIYKAIQLGVSPDNPSPSGHVNRVVQGVNLYPLTKGK